MLITSLILFLFEVRMHLQTLGFIDTKNCQESRFEKIKNLIKIHNINWVSLLIGLRWNPTDINMILEP